jgi:signal transduction histidine kinase
MVLTTTYDPGSREVIFSCRDFGCGVPDAIRDEIFTPFFTTKPAGEGTGLGLYISHELARKHGGRLELAGVSGEGAEFVLRLPAAAGFQEGMNSEGIDTAHLDKK